MNMKTIILLLLSTQIFANDYVNFFNKINSFSANFTQTIDGNQSSAGEMFFLRKNKIKWHIKTPNEQILLLNNGKFINYDIELEQAVIKNYNNNKLLRYIITKPKDLLQLPIFLFKKDKVNFYQISNIIFGFKNKILHNIVLVNNLEQKVIITFNNVVINPQLSADSFKLELADEVDIIY